MFDSPLQRNKIDKQAYKSTNSIAIYTSYLIQVKSVHGNKARVDVEVVVIRSLVSVRIRKWPVAGLTSVLSKFIWVRLFAVLEKGDANHGVVIGGSLKGIDRYNIGAI